MFELDRRGFIKVLASGTAASMAALGGGLRVAFGAPGTSDNILIAVFLRGGCDGLNLVPPIGGNDRTYYELLRPDIAIPTGGANAALPLGNSNGRFGFHPKLGALRDLYQSGQLAVVLGAGMPAPVTRSHFDAQATMELGTPGRQGIGSGWLTRHLASTGLPGNLVMPAVSAGSITATSLVASTHAVTMANGSDFRLDRSAWGWNARDRTTGNVPGFAETLPLVWAGGGTLEAAGRETLAALATLRPMDFKNYAPANGAAYKEGVSFDEQLRMLAQLIKSGVGLRAAAIDLASWDTHNNQDYEFGVLCEHLARGLGNFHKDLSGSGANNYMSRVSMVVMSEFGRRVKQNGSRGTDHGYGGVMLALGGGVNGGKIYGLNEFKGLADEQLFEGEDVDVSIDFRRVLAEALIRRQGNNRLGYVFPGYTAYAPLGIFQGTDLAPDYSTDGWDRIFRGTFD